MLSYRLKTIADLVPSDSRVIDVGCDHGLLDIYLTKYKNCSCVASDINIACLKKAQANIEKANLQEKIKICLSNGLEKIDYSSNDYIIISGMGFQTIAKILEKDKPEHLIIQSNTEIEELRKFLFKDYKLIDEKIVLERNIYYVIMKLEKGLKKYKYSNYIIGLNGDNKEYIDYLINKNEKIYNQLPKKYIFKRFCLSKKIKQLKNINLK